eukprot:472782_1
MSACYADIIFTTVASVSSAEDLLAVLKHIPIDKLKNLITQNITETDTSKTTKKNLNATSINKITNISKLSPILKELPLNSLKKFIHQSIEEMDASIAKTVYFCSLSLDDIMPSDIIQKFLSFQALDLQNVTLVNKQWNKLCYVNERNYYLQLQQRLDDECPISYDKQLNTTWIVDHRRSKLTAVEKELGFKGPSILIIATMDIQNCDRIFVHSGRCLAQGAYFIDKNTAIVGVGGQAIISDGMSYDDEIHLVVQSEIDMANSVSTRTCVYLENLEFDCNQKMHGRQGVIKVEPTGKLFLKKCKIRSKDTGIVVRSLSCLSVNECEFDGATTAIELSPITEKVVVLDSLFTHCGLSDDIFVSGEKACIQMNDAYGDLMHIDFENESDEIPFAQLICDGNLFTDNLCYPIAERARAKLDDNGERFVAEPQDKAIFVDKKELQILLNNKLSGYNATKVKKIKKKIEDANKIYFNNENYSMYDRK